MLVLGGQLPVSVRKTLLMQVLPPLVQYMCLLTCIWRYVSRTFSLIRLNGGVRLSLFQINTYLPHVPMSVESSARPSSYRMREEHPANMPPNGKKDSHHKSTEALHKE